MSQIRKDPLSGRHVLIAAGRAERPGHSTTVAASEPCPFCAGNESMTPPEVFAIRKNIEAGTIGWSVRIVPNKYPALLRNAGEQRRIEGFYAGAPALGAHEVVIESSEHIVNMALLSKGDFAIVLQAYRARLQQLRSEKQWSYLLVYKNQGARAGATLEHIHSQIIALPDVPQQTTEEIDNNRNYFERYGRCLSCQMIEQESINRSRLVIDDGHFVAICPFASRFAYENWILPKRHTSLFENGSEEDLIHLAGVLREMLIRLDRAVDHLSFNYVIHTAPSDSDDDRDYHWRIEILPRISTPAGFEWGSGCFINPVAPEAAALRLGNLG
jgi:UDPglucose--hexose-1-phosphate uridylyltransferase